MHFWGTGTVGPLVGCLPRANLRWNVVIGEVISVMDLRGSVSELRDPCKGSPVFFSPVMKFRFADEAGASASREQHGETVVVLVSWC